ncbi:putative ribosomal RNA small subunit methyltransferase A [Candidatus Nitrososphaera gargensis Ga9.2]|uniref:Putative ribosomal RNA small subunit methyltransferase A n=1 Tax=Nitrososphaera gargensis (strain Ga9.2) TaxID=1237085 RepID=K0IDG2_NITGG|nr:16S rRNA (adenine(1518)-N(6)/adenine(1519)-N(6))-dimethyltransferase RsmA [Candidatus Nitrososphaera gargensis]AFU59441.1 putative ribosomal RNA small subunit methyltransferase A [Candidatus Nitrososphaera gargensis Ga9.2]
MPNITKTLGQHMLVDARVLGKIIDAARISKNETVLEAGTGRGILTAELCKVARHVVSYEVDRKLYQQAQERLQFQNLELANADLFKTTGLRFDVFVSNLPYSRSRDAFEWLAVQKFNRAIVMVQEEFADKLAARPGSKNYRAISALAAHCFAIERLFSVGRQSFQPQPKVESVVIRIVPTNTVTKETIKNLNLLFSKRNKKASTVAAKARVKVDFGSKRVDQLAPGDLIRVAESISNVCSI